MDAKTILVGSLKTALILSLIFILLANSFQLILFNQRFYCYEFNKQDSFEKLAEKGVYDVDCGVAEKHITYFNQKEDDLINVDFYNEDEKSHMLDVKILINKIQKINYLVLGIFVLSFIVLFAIDKKQFNKNLGKVFLITGLIVIVLTMTFIFLSLNFSSIFSKFHEIFFPQGNWLFPSNSNMIILFSTNFFFEGFAFILLLNVLQSFLLLLISFFVLVKKIKII